MTLAPLVALWLAALPPDATDQPAAVEEPTPAAPIEASTPLSPPEPSPAESYAAGSVTTLGSASLGVGIVGTSPAGAGFTTGTLTGGVAVRWITRFRLTLEPRIGADGLLASGPSGLYAVFAARVGLGVGMAFSPGGRIGLAPMIAYEAVLVGGGVTSHLSGLQHTVAVEVPASFFFARNVFVELFLRGGVAATPVGAVPIFALGYRIGLVWR